MVARNTLDPSTLGAIVDRLTASNARFAARHPGDRLDRQPVHTVYGGAHLFRADIAARLGAHALAALDEYAPTADWFAGAFGLRRDLAQRVYERVRDKLGREPVEDFRVDFEDGYGTRPDAEEDAEATRVAAELARGAASGLLPPSIGIRIKPLGEELKRRALRTLDLVLTELVGAATHHSRRGKALALPARLIVTLPKVTTDAHVEALADACEALETTLKLPHHWIAIELMVETPRSILAEDGTVPLTRFVAAGRGRVTGAHFGAYDYTAGSGITAAHQAMGHPACDFARQVMQVALAGTGVWLSDGATNVMPVPVHRAAEGRPLTDQETEENLKAVHAAWKRHFDDATRSLVQGFYQGWDLHPAQLPSRYAAVYAFFLEGLTAASERLRTFASRAAQATLVGDVFDDAATGQGLLNYFLRALNSGAITEAEAVELSGLTLDELRSRSFVKILEGRRKL